MTYNEPEKLATVELCAHVWVVVVGDSRIGPFYVESEANDIAESVNSTHKAASKSFAQRRVDEALERAARDVEEYDHPDCDGGQIYAERIRGLKGKFK